MSEQGQTYFEFLKAELDREYDRRSSLQARAGSLGGFSTAAFAAVAAVWAFAFGKSQVLSRPAADLLVAALVLFLLSTLAAVLVYSVFLFGYQVASQRTRDHMLGDHWVDSEVNARNFVGTLVSKTLTTLRKGNNVSGRILLCAGIGQALALTSVIAAVAVEARGML